MGTKRGLERLIFFTDAVVAIAITLLILPVIERIPHSGGGAGAVETYLSTNLSQLLAFVLSFVIIARMWMANHEILEHVERSTTTLMWLDIAWVFSVVIIPLPTEVVATFNTDDVTVGIYIGSVGTSSLILTIIAFYLYRHPRLETDDGHTSRERLWGVGSTSAAFVIAFILGVFVPGVNYYALLVLLLTIPLDHIMKPRFKKWDAERRVPHSQSAPHS